MARRRKRGAAPIERLKPAGDFRPSDKGSFTTEAAREAAWFEADRLGEEAGRIEQAARRELESLKLPVTIAELELYFRELPVAHNERRRKRLRRGHDLFVALLLIEQARGRAQDGDMVGAERAMRDGLGYSLAADAERGASILSAARAGGSKTLPSGDWAAWQTTAEALWRGKPTLSTRAVADVLSRRTGIPASTIRRHIHRP